MIEDGITEQVALKFRRLKLDVLEISETRWTGEGEEKLDTGDLLLYSGRTDNLHHQGKWLMNGSSCS